MTHRDGAGDERRREKLRGGDAGGDGLLEGEVELVLRDEGEPRGLALGQLAELVLGRLLQSAAVDVDLHVPLQLLEVPV